MTKSLANMFIALLLFVILLPLRVLGQDFYLKVEYPTAYDSAFAEVNGVKVYSPSDTVIVKPGDKIEGFFNVRVKNCRGGAWITPAIGTASWTRGWYECITNDAPTGESMLAFRFSLKAPEKPGTYYIGVFAGWMYSCDEVASNDHPPKFGDGDDVWDMSQRDWEELISAGQASTYNQPGRAIRIIVRAEVEHQPAISDLVDTAIRVSVRAAEYVISRAETEKGGLKWATYHGSTKHYNNIFQDGAAGVGYFLISLYLLTQNKTYLDYAIGAAQWIISEVQYKDGGFTWPHYDNQKPRPSGWYLTPFKSVAGIAEFLLDLYKITNNKTYLEYSEGAARWIINTALKKDVQGYYVEYNPYHQAAFGIYSYVQSDVGSLMIHLYNITKNLKYLNYAVEIANWIVYTAQCSGNICKWFDDRGYGNVYAVGGMTSLANFLYDMYSVTQNQKYKQVADGFLDWIESVGYRGDFGIKFKDSQGKYRTIVEGDWDRLLIMTPADVFIKAYKVAGDIDKLLVAEKYLSWLISISVEEDGGLKVPLVDGESHFHAWINARIFNLAIQLFTVTKKQLYLDYAIKLLSWIERSANNEKGYYWTIPQGRAQSIFYYGSSGIGYYIVSSLFALGNMGQPIKSSSSMRTRTFNITFSLHSPFSTPMENAIVKVSLPNGTTSTLTTGEGGQLTILGVSEGRVDITVVLWRNMPVNFVIRGVTNGTLTVQNIGKLIVKVRGARGQGIEGAYITITAPPHNIQFTGSTDRNGIFEAELPTGTYCVTAEKDGKMAHACTSLSQSSITEVTLTIDVFMVLGDWVLSTADFVGLILLTILVVAFSLALKYALLRRSPRLESSRAEAGTGVKATSKEFVRYGELVSELDRLHAYLAKLEGMRKRGEVSDAVYAQLKSEYEGRIRELKQKLDSIARRGEIP